MKYYSLEKVPKQALNYLASHIYNSGIYKGDSINHSIVFI